MAQVHHGQSSESLMRFHSFSWLHQWPSKHTFFPTMYLQSKLVVCLSSLLDTPFLSSD
uniref:Uncharacterized protein n=1 Tax=Brassica oleracea var. oleracea TaxID=109376 RepID=A0A0D3AKU4_BRAOL